MMLKVNGPWDEKKITDLGKEYNHRTNNDFSWVLDAERDYLVLDNDNGAKKSDKSVEWGIPNQMIGNPDTANFFLCLLNPRTTSDTSAFNDPKNNLSLNDYIEKEKESLKDNEYYAHIIDDQHNVLKLEAEQLMQTEVYKKHISPKIIANRKQKIVDLIKDCWITQYPKHADKVSDSEVLTKKWDDDFKDEFNIQFDDEFTKLIQKQFDYFLDKYVQDINAGKSGNFSQKQFDDDFYSKIEQTITKWHDQADTWRVADLDNLFNEKTVSFVARKVGKFLDPFKEQYYLSTYYWHILADKLDKTEFYENLYKEPDLANKFNNYHICNLELFPYRTNGVDGIHLKHGFHYGDLKSTQYVVSRIIKRIYSDTNKTEPYFVFRAYGGWKQAIEEYLDNLNSKKNKTDWEEKATGKTIADIEKYFYGFPNANASLTETNLKEIDGDEKVDIDGDKYTEMKQAITEN